MRRREKTITCSIFSKKSSRIVFRTSIFFAGVVWSFAICFTMLLILICLQRSPSPRPVISCIAPITFPKIRLPSFRPWDITPRRNSPCLRTSGSPTRPRSTKSISNMHATAARNASLIISSTVTMKKPIPHMKSRDVSGTDARDVSSAIPPTGSMVKPCRNFTVPLWKRSSIEYSKRQGYNVVEEWECDVRWELYQNEGLFRSFPHCRAVRAASCLVRRSNQCGQAVPLLSRRQENQVRRFYKPLPPRTVPRPYRPVTPRSLPKILMRMFSMMRNIAKYTNERNSDQTHEERLSCCL